MWSNKPQFQKWPKSPPKPNGTPYFHPKQLLLQVKQLRTVRGVMSLSGLENSKYQGTKRWVVYTLSSFWYYEVHQIGPAPTHTELTQYELLSGTFIYLQHFGANNWSRHLHQIFAHKTPSWKYRLNFECHFLQEPSICRHFDSLPLIFCSSGPRSFDKLPILFVQTLSRF